MIDGRQGQSHHIEIGGRVLLQAGDHYEGVTEQLVEPGSDLFRDRQRLAPLDSGNHFQQIGPLDLVDRTFTQEGQHVLGKDPGKNR